MASHKNMSFQLLRSGSSLRKSFAGQDHVTELLASLPSIFTPRMNESRSAYDSLITRNAPRTLIQSSATYPKCPDSHVFRNIVADNACNKNPKKDASQTPTGLA